MEVAANTGQGMANRNADAAQMVLRADSGQHQ
jgi:hypothetical protein